VTVDPDGALRINQAGHGGRIVSVTVAVARRWPGVGSRAEPPAASGSRWCGASTRPLARSFVRLTAARRDDQQPVV